MIPGIDVSHWQKEIDWKQVKNAGFRFAFYKATEFPLGKSELFIDDQLLNNAAGTSANRIHNAPYHFFRTHIPGYVQAQGFLHAIKDLPFTLAPVLDLEVSGKHGKNLVPMILEFCEAVEDALKVKPIIYTSGSFWREYVIYGDNQNALPFAGYTLWLAQWGFTFPRPVYPFPMAKFWQYSETGRVPGVITNCDLDYFLGDEIGFLPHFCLNRYTDNPPKIARLDK